jgi:succinoglycan biosynthesis transport protein ExoP
MEEYEGIELKAYLTVIRRWLWLIVLVIVLAGGMALVISAMTPPVYQAEAAVVVMRSDAVITFEPQIQTVSETFADRVKALSALVRNSAVASQVIEELGSTLAPEERKVEALLGMVTARPDGELIKILVKTGSPEKAAAIANVWARAYEEYVNQYYEESSLTLGVFQAQAAEALKSYEQAEEALARLLGDNQIDALSREITAGKSTLADYYAAKQRLDRLITDARALQNQLREDTHSSQATARNSLSLLVLKANASNVSSALPVQSSQSYVLPSLDLSVQSYVLPSPDLSVQYSQPYVLPSSDLPVQLLLSFGPIPGGDEEEAQLMQEVVTLVANLEARRTEVQQSIDDSSLQQEILQLEEQLELEQAKKQQLTGARDLAWQTYQTLARKEAEVNVAAQVKETEVRFVTSAVEPKTPVSPRRMQNTLLASAVGAMLAVGVSFLIEYLDDSIRTPEDMRRAVGLSILSSLAPLPTGADSELITLSQPRSPTSEGFRALRTQIQMAADKPPSTLLVTSPNPLEGKSTIVANLGVVMAQAGRSTILVDSDMRRPVLHEMFGLSNAQGLSNALSDDGSDPGQYLQATRVENLRVLTSGPLPPNPSELLSSPRVEELIHQLGGEAAVLLFDSPAALPVTDAVLLAKKVDGVLLVVESGVTRRGAAQQALEGFIKVGASLVGVVLNRFSAGVAAEYYQLEGDQSPRRSKSNRGLQSLKRLLDNVTRKKYHAN